MPHAIKITVTLAHRLVRGCTTNTAASIDTVNGNDTISTLHTDHPMTANSRPLAARWLVCHP